MRDRSTSYASTGLREIWQRFTCFSRFDVLAAHGAIERELADQMRAIVRVRNRIAHGYASVDHDCIHAEAPTGVTTLRRFLSVVAAAARA